MKTPYEMDPLDVAALEERVNKLIDSCSAEAVANYMEYGEVIRLLWENEFKLLILRTQEITAKLPTPVIRVAFLRFIIQEVVGPLSAHDAAGLLMSVANDICANTRAIYKQVPMRIIGIAADAAGMDRQGQPGLR